MQTDHFCYLLYIYLQTFITLFRAWWIGNCENVGSDNGNASGQGRCPAKVREWREKWSGNLVENSILLQVL